ncbi:Alpha/Beta hydrolase protein [Aspergillus egyptiacus]|nr:Alpha/Beta hydrolase protein [Aspergillus egyptiacus]
MPKYLPSPIHSFSIPSIYDSVQLACRVYLPPQLLDSGHTSQWRVRGAIVAHPYASLGGSYDDPIVNFIGAELLEAGYVVGTFNFRGAGDSEGRTSWTARPELADYVSFYGFMMLYLRLLRLRIESRYGKQRTSRDTHLILGGYSFGSLIASHLPSSDAVVDLFNHMVQGSLSHGIFITARILCVSADSHIQSLQQSPASSTASVTHNAEDVLKSSDTTISYLLISPLLPPLTQFLTFFMDLSLLEVDDQGSGERRQIRCPKPKDQLCSYSTLAIYGDQDTFTSISRLRKWSDELRSAPRSRFLSTEIEGAGHFWREEGVEPRARHSLRLWLRQQP